MREYLGPDHPIVKAVLGTKSPDDKARELVDGSSLADPKVRMKLFEGGAAALNGSTDPMIALAREVDAEARRLRKIVRRSAGDRGRGPAEDRRGALQDLRHAGLSRRDVHACGSRTEPLRDGASPARASSRSRGSIACTREPQVRRPSRCPSRGSTRSRRLDMNTRANFVTTNDIVGGNSGSPMVNAAGASSAWRSTATSTRLRELLVRSADESGRRRAPGVHPDGAGAGVSRDRGWRRSSVFNSHYAVAATGGAGGCS